MMAAGIWLLGLSLGSALSGGRGTDQVPLLAWSTDGSLWHSQPAPNEGHIVSEQQLVSYLRQALGRGPKTIILFLQEKLSVEDFTVYGGVYGNKQDSAFHRLQGALESSPSSLVLPSVDWHATSSLLPLLQATVGTGPLYVDPLTIRDLRLNASVPSLLAVRLPYSSGSILIRPKEALAANDDIVGKMLDVLKEDGVPFTAILTASRPSRVVQAVPPAPPAPGRHLLGLQDEGERTHPPLAFNQSGGPCILLWASQLWLSRGKDQVDLTNRTFGSTATVSLHHSACTNHSTELVLQYSNVEKLGAVKISFKLSNQTYRVSAKPWFTLDQVEVSSDKDAITFNVTDVYAPAAYSYRCGYISNDPASGSVLRSTSTSQPWRLQIYDFQIQAFGVKGLRFSYASDCSGFFTPAVWMGLLTSLLMVFILTYGLHMVTSLKTMDRFDDPKGPSISVPQTE